MSGLPPPPPPQTCAATFTQSPAFKPLAINDAGTHATMETFPSAASGHASKIAVCGNFVLAMFSAANKAGASAFSNRATNALVAAACSCSAMSSFMRASVLSRVAPSLSRRAALAKSRNASMVTLSDCLCECGIESDCMSWPISETSAFNCAPCMARACSMRA